jgi:hypothetical protein
MPGCSAEKEIAIRLALGGEPRRIVNAIMQEFLTNIDHLAREPTATGTLWMLEVSQDVG